ncbi:MAG: Fis family transcriptional regulator [Spirochaetae bacterium HGW-Spirochaetae-8]|jgi:propionate catabolism operon transcriptional regulator|nr:MAG: Fis family transcriptional regulator [Spirochaetae bacterium HGW-Spirochaetae-8]
MIKILVVVPYEELYTQVREYLETLDTRDFIVELEHIVGTNDRSIKQRDADIVVARGITGKAMARENPNIHLVDISISSSDLITALWKGRDWYQGGKVGVIVTDIGICDPVQLKDLTGIDLLVRKAEDENEVYAAIEELAAQGVSTFVGGLTLCRKCDALKLRSIHIKTGGEAMMRALNEAVAAARSLNRERTRANLVTTVLNNTEDVMFALNRHGLVIAANSQASFLFLGDRDNPLEGRHIDDFYPEASWRPTLETQIESEILQTIGGQLMLVNHSPIMVDTESVGILITCRNVEALRETEQKIRKELSAKGLVAHYHFGNIICENQQMKQLIATAYKYSQVDSNVFIIGETGTGKELFAQSIHNASKRSSHPFVAVNCAALPEQLLESELFGYTEGSFSGAVKGGKMGLFELAHKGTIFLDEIGEMPLQIQAKILRVLQEREIRRVGGDTVIPIDVRIISATNINILNRVQNGAFRQDLYYRINLLNLKIPPLRQRPEDIELIFRHFVRKYATEAGKTVPLIDPQVIPIMQSFVWQGNIRELRNFSERMVILNESGVIDCKEVETFYLFDDRGAVQERLIDKPAQEIGSVRAASLARQLEQSGLDRDAFAKSLGLSRTTLWRRLRDEQNLQSHSSSVSS